MFWWQPIQSWSLAWKEGNRQNGKAQREGKGGEHADMEGQIEKLSVSTEGLLMQDMGHLVIATTRHLIVRVVGYANWEFRL